MWSNIISVGCVLFAVLIAVGWWEDIAFLLAKQVPAMLFVVDCIAIWVLFLVALALLDLATRGMSTIKVKYNDTVEKVGNGIALFLLFLVLFGVHTIANGHMGMVGEHPNASVSESAGTNAALAMIRLLSAGNLSAFVSGNQFDDRGDFRTKHLQRRKALMDNAKSQEGPWQQIQYNGTVPARRGG